MLLPPLTSGSRLAGGVFRELLLPAGAMILSALTTSVGINLALTVLLAAAYSLLRRRPPYVEVYSPRRPYAPLEPWLAAAWRRAEEDIHAAAGLDGVVFIRIFVFRLVGPSRARRTPSIPTSSPFAALFPQLGPFPCSLECAYATRVVQHQGVRGGRGARGRRAPAGELPR